MTTPTSASMLASRRMASGAGSSLPSAPPLGARTSCSRATGERGRVLLGFGTPCSWQPVAQQPSAQSPVQVCCAAPMRGAGRRPLGSGMFPHPRTVDAGCRVRYRLGELLGGSPCRRRQSGGPSSRLQRRPVCSCVCSVAAEAHAGLKRARYPRREQLGHANESHEAARNCARGLRAPDIERGEDPPIYLSFAPVDLTPHTRFTHHRLIRSSNTTYVTRSTQPQCGRRCCARPWRAPRTRGAPRRRLRLLTSQAARRAPSCAQVAARRRRTPSLRHPAATRQPCVASQVRLATAMRICAVDVRTHVDSTTMCGPRSKPGDGGWT